MEALSLFISRVVNIGSSIVNGGSGPPALGGRSGPRGGSHQPLGVLGHPLLGAVLDPVAAPTNHWRNPALDTYRQRIGPPHPARIIASLFIHLCISRHTISSVLEEFIYLRYTR